MSKWQLKEAQARFSEVIRKAAEEGPQEIKNRAQREREIQGEFIPATGLRHVGVVQHRESESVDSKGLIPARI